MLIDNSNNKEKKEDISTTEIFDDLNDQFVARLRRVASNTRTTSDGRATITFKTARIEANYTPEIMKKIEPGRLIAIPNVMGVGLDDSYSVYEIADAYPMHYSMLTLDESQPGAIRKEFMALIEEEWKKGSKSTWIEIVAAPTGYLIKYENDNESINVGNNYNFTKKNSYEIKFVRKNTSVLAGSRVHLLSKEMIQKFICYTPPKDKDAESYTVGSLLGVGEEQQIPFTLNLEKLIHYHVGVFAFTGSGKSNLTSLMIRKAANIVPNVKFVIFDISSEYGINILDILNSVPSRIVFTEQWKGGTPGEQAQEYLIRHVCPESLEDAKPQILSSIENIITTDKLRVLTIPADTEEAASRFRTYGGLIQAVTELTNDRYQNIPQKMLIPGILDEIKDFMHEHNLDDDSQMGVITIDLIQSINNNYISQTRLSASAPLRVIFENLELTLRRTQEHERRQEQQERQAASNITRYNTSILVDEIISQKENSPKVFVINLTDAEMARTFCADIINDILKRRKNSFTLDPRIVFVFDEAQEFIPQEKRREDGTDASSRAVERLLRHGRKYHLHGWISTQRIAYLNTNALQQLHSYFISTMPRPYDRQLISETFAIDDAFMDRTLMFENGDWLMTSFRATNTQNVPVFLHALNNEIFILH